MKQAKKIRHYNKRDTMAAWLMLSPFLIFFLLFVVYPIIMNVYYSFTNYNLNKADWVGLKNYQRLLKDKAFVAAVKNTAVYAFFSVLFLTSLGFLTASALNRSIRGIRWIRMLMIFPYATSMTAVAMIWLMLLDPTTGLINKTLRMVNLTGVDWLFNVKTALPCLIFVNIWKNIHVTVPMVRPVAFFVFINTMIESFKTFEQVKLMTGGDPLYSTTTIVHQIYQRGFAEFKMGYAAAMSVVLLVIVLVVTIVNYRFGSSAE